MAFLSAIFRRRYWPAAWRVAVACLLAVPLAGADSPRVAPTEYQMKALFLFNFAQFVEWPAATLPAAQAPLVIGVLGTDPFGQQLDELVQGENIKGHPIVVRRFQRVDEIADCHILFISASELDELDQVLLRLKGRSVLTVSDTDGFNRLGGMVRFVTENKRIRFVINVDAARSAELVISSRLLQLAKVYSPAKD